MMYKFYVRMDGDTFGPYTAREVRDLQLLDDILVTEESMDGWLPAGKFDFDDMARKEALAESVGEDGTIRRTGYVPPTPPVAPQPVYTPPSSYSTDRPYTPDEVPEEIKKWNWGAFFFNWIWGLFNGVYWPLVLIVVNFIPYIGGLLVFAACVVLGVKGSEWAWKGRSWRSVEHFKRVQRNWAWAVLWCFLGGIMLGIVVGMLTAMVS